MSSVVISSFSNPRVKELKQLYQKSSYRKKRGLFVVEGIREITQAIEGDFQLETLFYSPAILKELPPLFKELPTQPISQKIYNSLAYRGGVEGAIALFKERELKLEEIELSPTPLILIIEGVEKPGNIGAILRSADGSGVDAVIISSAKQELYNPNTIRASLGTLFSNQVTRAGSEEIYNWLKERNIAIYTAELEGADYYYNVDMRGAVALVVGSEAWGLEPFWRERADSRVKIPMLGRVDSLNVSVSAALLTYEAVRQRREKQ